MKKNQPVALLAAVDEGRVETRRHSKLVVAFLVFIVITWLFARLAYAEGDQSGQNLNNQINSASAATSLRNGNSSVSGSSAAAQAQRAKDQQKKDQAEFKELVMNNLGTIKELFAAAEAAWKEQHYAVAAPLYKSVEMATVPGAEDMVQTARGRRVELEDLAKGHLKNVEDADLSQDYMKEIDELSLILREFKTTSANDIASQKIVSLKSRPEVAGYIDYTQAESLEKDSKLLDAIKLYTSVANNPRFEHSVAALKAQRKLDELNKNEDSRNKLKAEMTAKADKEAPSLLVTAKNYLVNGKRQLAIEKLEKVVKDFPDTQYAAQAQKQIEELGAK